MKHRPDFTTSEYQLLLAMVNSGRAVTLVTLASWRKNGLLPPLACHGLGQGKGKTYYWREADIFPQACAAFDFLQRYSRPDAVLQMLWLSGFQVSLPQLRRAWLHRASTRAPWKTRPLRSDRKPPEIPCTIGNTGFEPSAALLLNAMLVLGDVFSGNGNGVAAADILDGALQQLTHDDDPALGDRLRAHLWTIIEVLAVTLDASDLMVVCSDEELLEAQRYFRVAGRFLQSCTDIPRPDMEAAIWSPQLAERAGPALFLLSLVLVRYGWKNVLDRAVQQIENAGPARAPDRHIDQWLTA